MLLQYWGKIALERGAMAGDNYDKIVGTLNYFETRKANQSLDNITDQLQRQEQQRRNEEYAQRQAEDEFLELCQRFEALAQSKPSPRTYYDSEVLRVRLKDFDDSFLSDFMLRERLSKMREGATDMRNNFAANLGLENQRKVNVLFEVPEKLAAARVQYLATAAYEATKDKRWLGALGVGGLAIAVGLLLLAWWIALAWDTIFVTVLDGRQSYLLAPTLATVGTAMLAYLLFSRFLERRRARKALAKASSEMDYLDHYPLLTPGASRKRLQQAKKDADWAMIDEDPHAIDPSTQASLREGISKLERKLAISREYTFGS
ncbi:hypothetical protein [Croceicoccus gelatinilyticus]|uniref:hypothetical protein n=1 Tax=Croceicoccus gelatinilyticus TaxID=2835536 RepID=UPI001BCDC36A|nr:hypothetical protein [Croceicoccus gelatinilyticus]MBS7671515.1 hypothetical protein [Croceicoccus gelatinilyticus]